MYISLEKIHLPQNHHTLKLFTPDTDSDSDCFEDEATTTTKRAIISSILTEA